MLCQFSSLTGCNRWILHLFSPFLSWIQCQGSAAKTWRLMSHLHLCPSCLFIFLLYISFFFLTFSSSAFQSYIFLSPSFFLHIQFCPPFRWLGPFFLIIFAFLFYISPASVVSMTLPPVHHLLTLVHSCQARQWIISHRALAQSEFSMKEHLFKAIVSYWQAAAVEQKP